MKCNPLLISVAFVLWLAGPVFGDSSPMVERHIFMPEKQDETTPGPEKEKSPEVEKLERELLFTGIIIGPDGKQAMIREKAHPRTKEAEKASLLREGDEIRGMTLKEIGTNYLVLVGEGGDVRLNLFQEGKERPAPPPEPKAVAAPAAAQAGQPGGPRQPQAAPGPGISGQPPQRVSRTQTVTPGQETQSPNSSTEAVPKSNPFAEALKRARQQNITEGRRNVVNPFLDAIRRQGNQAQ